MVSVSSYQTLLETCKPETSSKSMVVHSKNTHIGEVIISRHFSKLGGLVNLNDKTFLVWRKFSGIFEELAWDTTH